MTTVQVPTTTEREALAGFLLKQQEALIGKVAGVCEEDARKAPTASSLSLLGLLKHAALWERRWFHLVLTGRLVPGEWPADESGDGEEDFELGDEDTVEGWTARFRENAAVSREIVAAMDLDTPCGWPRLAHRNLRWVLLHMIEEYARHAGHADIIRETLDGTRGV
ncbi:DinB family protein [Kitasatospora kazusensis]|uniref:DinB family protein n=1 Tax=Kitasatospora kazusensis TaxID=407974 RepID=A0ABP5KNK2_9ACTN